MVAAGRPCLWTPLRGLGGVRRLFASSLNQRADKSALRVREVVEPDDAWFRAPATYRSEATRPDLPRVLRGIQKARPSGPVLFGLFG